MLRITLIAAALLCALSPADARLRHRHVAQEATCNPFDIMHPCVSAFAGSTKARRAASKSFAARRVAERRQTARTHQRRAMAAQESFGGAVSGLVERARAYIGRTGPSLGLPARLWCSDFANMITGGGTGSRFAKSWLSRPHVAPQVGALVVMGRKGGGHVGFVSGFTPKGDPIVISGNHGRRVGEGGLPTLARARLCQPIRTKLFGSCPFNPAHACAGRDR
jgi:CHAP domain-containing protein